MDWPGEANLGKLTRAAVPLFIFAATLCRFINDRYLGNPDELLQSVLNVAGTGQGSKLDMTYSPVLRQQVLNRSGSERLDIIESFRLIVGTIVTLANPLSMRALALLIDVHVNIPETLDAPVRLLHLSFRDYLVGLEKRELAEFRVEERHTHQSLAKHCLRIMRGGLRKNVCGLSFPGMRRSSVDFGQLEKRMPSQLQYACMHWAYHQTSGKPELSDDKEVYGFLTTHFLHWLEAMSLIGRVKECLDALRSLARWVETREDSSLSTFVADAERFVQAYFSVVAEAPLQIYCCLAFAPRKSVIRRTFKNVIPTWISNLPKIEENWDACLLTLEGHSREVNSVVFSHDSKKVASASNDKTIRIWNAETGECERVLKGHSREVNSVVFSHDSKKVASGSIDKTIRIWNAETGECEKIVPLYGYAHVSSFATDGRGIVTDRGVFALTGGSQPHAEPAMLRQSSVAPILACTDGTWIIAAGEDLLWLPPECRNGQVAVSGSIVVRWSSGRIHDYREDQGALDCNRPLEVVLQYHAKAEIIT
ncbi:hypothetical protein FOXB_16560 [Fusarium oxysporum f. sp. conglutinans Fo5176]|uniref:Mitochondrial division protein 1 n=1 Tax=Fusarium oxysporum (strain Fo5176) TaxID=660025 RepID=F9GD26_FUSOF|nr:hypothetical protein FOXB_16560 [Fusarium oxysporum f. sp. conglutinans Fo5176]